MARTSPSRPVGTIVNYAAPSPSRPDNPAAIHGADNRQLARGAAARTEARSGGDLAAALENTRCGQPRSRYQ